jgi:hypothetical protein
VEGRLEFYKRIGKTEAPQPRGGGATVGLRPAAAGQPSTEKPAAVATSPLRVWDLMRRYPTFDLPAACWPRRLAPRRTRQNDESRGARAPARGFRGIPGKTQGDRDCRRRPGVRKAQRFVITIRYSEHIAQRFTLSDRVIITRRINDLSSYRREAHPTIVAGAPAPTPAGARDAPAPSGVSMQTEAGGSQH